MGGAGLAMSIMSIAVLYLIGPLQELAGLGTTEVRVTIFLGFIVFTVAVLYEIYRKKVNNGNPLEEKFKQNSNLNDST